LRPAGSFNEAVFRSSLLDPERVAEIARLGLAPCVVVDGVTEKFETPIAALALAAAKQVASNAKTVASNSNLMERVMGARSP
jgi:hypothetical protein